MAVSPLPPHPNSSPNGIAAKARALTVSNENDIKEEKAGTSNGGGAELSEQLNEEERKKYAKGTTNPPASQHQNYGPSFS
jgi:hypothetical protein